jgi:hypothetical protein
MASTGGGSGDEYGLPNVSDVRSNFALRPVKDAGPLPL